MININIPFDFKEKVYYISLNWFTYCVSEGEVFGIHVYNRKGKLDTRIIFKNGSSVIDLVFRNKEDAKNKAKELQEKHDNEYNRLNRQITLERGNIG